MEKYKDDKNKGSKVLHFQNRKCEHVNSEFNADS